MIASSRRLCGEYTLEHNRKTMSKFVKHAFLAYFKVILGDQDKPWPLHVVCKLCLKDLRQWTNKSKKSLEFPRSLSTFLVFLSKSSSATILGSKFLKETASGIQLSQGFPNCGP